MAPPKETSIVHDRLLLIVVGAHLAAEKEDRPHAYRLLARISEALADFEAPLDPLVCSDIWYMNQNDLMQRPSIAIGGPGVNAAAAYFANRLPTAFVLDDTFQILHDVELSQMGVALWGRDAAATSAAVDHFAERYLGRFLGGAHGGAIA